MADAIQSLYGILMNLNGNRLFWGLTSVIMNLGVRHIHTDLAPRFDALFASDVFKRCVVFSMFFVATHDVITSLLMTAAFFFVFYVVLQKLPLFVDPGDPSSSPTPPHPAPAFCLVPGTRNCGRTSGRLSASAVIHDQNEYYTDVMAQNDDEDRRLTVAGPTTWSGTSLAFSSTL